MSAAGERGHQLVREYVVTAVRDSTETRLRRDAETSMTTISRSASLRLTESAQVDVGVEVWLRDGEDLRVGDRVRVVFEVGR